MSGMLCECGGDLEDPCCDACKGRTSLNTIRARVLREAAALAEYHADFRQNREKRGAAEVAAALWQAADRAERGES
jgi:hypothetical protein